MRLAGASGSCQEPVQLEREALLPPRPGASGVIASSWDRGAALQHPAPGGGHAVVLIVSPFQISQRSTDGFSTDQLPRTNRNFSGILSGSISLINASPERIDLEEGTERPGQPGDFRG